MASLVWPRAKWLAAVSARLAADCGGVVSAQAAEQPNPTAAMSRIARTACARIVLQGLCSTPDLFELPINIRAEFAPVWATSKPGSILVDRVGLYCDWPGP